MASRLPNTDGTFVGVFDEQPVDIQPSYDAFGNVVRSETITGATILPPLPLGEGWGEGPSRRENGQLHSFNRTKLEKDSGYTGTFSPDEVFTYDYDANDRLIFEWLNNDADAEIDQTTEYGYDHTQQTSKTVYGGFVDDATPLASYPLTTSRQLYAYNLQGRRSSVVNEGYNTSGVITSRERTSYEYDSKSFRAELVTETDSALNGTYTLVSRTEFLADHHNHTGYTQAIRETTYDAAGAVTKQVDYTFGHDEISQTVTEGGTTATHIFGHDGHGSVRVLYDLAETTANLIEQAFTFAAYGEIIAVHGSDGVAVHGSDGVAVPTTAALTNLGYSGEHFDAKVQQQYLRARWYDPANGRFNRLDPFAGNTQDPQSLHKYAYVHGNPVQGIDPTGMSLLGSVFSGLSVARSYVASVGSNYVARQAVISTLQTGLEGMAIRLLNSYVFDDDPLEFNFGTQFLTNFGSNLLTGRLKGFFAKNLIDTIFLSFVDIFQGKPPLVSILANGLGAFGGELAFGIATRIFKKADGLISSATIRQGLSSFSQNVQSRVDDFAESAGFSGVFDEATGEFIAIASGSTTMKNGRQPKFFLAEQLGGHWDVNQILTYLVGRESVERLGFSFTKQADGRLAVGFNSGQINAPNPTFEGRTVPPEKRQQILDALSRATGLDAFDSSL